MRISQATAQGNRPYQEDRFGIEKLFAGTLVWIADGHGGDEVSQYIQENLRRIWINADNDDRVEQIEAVFSQLHNETWEFKSGSTLSLAYITKGSNREVYTAVLGDSPVLVGHDGLFYKGPDHNARSNVAEREVAMARGAFYDGGYVCKHYDGPGLQMTRALGDSDLTFLNREPEIWCMPFDKRGDFVLVASDGVVDPSHHSSDGLDVLAGLIMGEVEPGAEAPELVTRAIKIPTNDNATAILVRV